MDLVPTYACLTLYRLFIIKDISPAHRFPSAQEQIYEHFTYGIQKE